jgi:hypothetical protein
MQDDRTRIVDDLHDERGRDEARLASADVGPSHLQPPDPMPDARIPW